MDFSLFQSDKINSFTLDTACSSSIYCLHNAVNAIKAGECEGAVVAGANLIMGPEQHLGTMKGGVLSPTSTCHTFDASADGYGRAEGVSALYIKRLSAALRDGDPIRAVIRGTAVNAYVFSIQIRLSILTVLEMVKPPVSLSPVSRDRQKSSARPTAWLGSLWKIPTTSNATVLVLPSVIPWKLKL